MLQRIPPYPVNPAPVISTHPAHINSDPSPTSALCLGRLRCPRHWQPVRQTAAAHAPHAQSLQLLKSSPTHTTTAHCAPLRSVLGGCGAPGTGTLAGRLLQRSTVMSSSVSAGTLVSTLRTALRVRRSGRRSSSTLARKGGSKHLVSKRRRCGVTEITASSSLYP